MLWKPPQGHFFEENSKNLDSLDLLTNRLRSNVAQGHRCKRIKTHKITKNRPPGVSTAWPAQKIMFSKRTPPNTIRIGCPGAQAQILFFVKS